MEELTVLDWVVSIALTWTLGLGLAVILRFLVFKRPLNNGAAITIAILWFIPNFLFWVAVQAAAGGGTTTHAVQFVMAYISYRIMIKKNKSDIPKSNEFEQAELEKKNLAETERKKQAAKDWSQ